MMSGSQNRLYRKGSIASRESGPPSWNKTTPSFNGSPVQIVYINNAASRNGTKCPGTAVSSFSRKAGKIETGHLVRFLAPPAQRRSRLARSTLATVARAFIVC